MLLTFGCERKGVAGFVFSTTPLPKARPSLLYLAFFTSFLVLVSVFFGGRQPQPQGFFLSAIFITFFLCLCIEFRRYGHAPGTQPLEMTIKYLGNCLKSVTKKTLYAFFVISEIRSRTVCSSFSSFLSYFLRDAKLAWSNSCSLNFPVPWHPHEQTSFNTCRHLSIPSSSIEYGIQYPFRSFLTRPACLSILRCCDTAAGVIPINSAMSLTQSGPSDFKSSIALTRVSTDSALNTSEGTWSIFSFPISIKYLSNYLNYTIREEICQGRIWRVSYEISDGRSPMAGEHWLSAPQRGRMRDGNLAPG